MKRTFLFLTLSAVLFAADQNTTATKQNLTGAQIYTKHGCYGCHGADAKGIGDYPRLAGKSVYYLSKRLEGYKHKTIHSDRAPIMQSFAAPLSDAEIKALAKYLNSLGKQKKITDEERYFEDYVVGDSSGS